MLESKGKELLDYVAAESKKAFFCLFFPHIWVSWKVFCFKEGAMYSCSSPMEHDLALVPIYLLCFQNAGTGMLTSCCWD